MKLSKNHSILAYFPVNFRVILCVIILQTIVVFSVSAQQASSAGKTATNASIAHTIGDELNRTPATVASQKAKTSVTPKTEKRYFDNGYFTYEITGDEARDAQSYTDAKIEFVKNNPAKYKQWVEQSKPTEKIIVPKSDFDKMPKDKQEKILSNPGQFQIK
jgi:hypothetical protein